MKMKTQTISYTYDPEARSLTQFIDGKPRGGFIGPEAENRFNQLLLGGAEISITSMTTEKLRKDLIRKFHACLANQGILKHKEDILSGLGVVHTTELSTEQLKELVMQYSTHSLPNDATAPVPKSARIRLLRSDLLTLCNKMGLYVTNNDWTAVNQFFMKHCKKPMYQMGEAELVKARKQFNSILDWMEKKGREVERMKLLN